jgi:hypothetical protein
VFDIASEAGRPAAELQHLDPSLVYPGDAAPAVAAEFVARKWGREGDRADFMTKCPSVGKSVMWDWWGKRARPVHGHMKAFMQGEARARLTEDISSLEWFSPLAPAAAADADTSDAAVAAALAASVTLTQGRHWFRSTVVASFGSE